MQLASPDASEMGQPARTDGTKGLLESPQGNRHPGDSRSGLHGQVIELHGMFAAHLRHCSTA